MILSELFDSKVDYKVIVENPKVFATLITLRDKNDKPVQIAFEALFLEKSKDWALNFGVFKSLVGDELYMRFGRIHEFQAPKILAFAKRSTEEFLKKYDPPTFKFMATKDRSDVYARMIERFKVPGYQLEKKEEGQNSQDFHHFNFTKVQK